MLPQQLSNFDLLLLLIPKKKTNEQEKNNFLKCKFNFIRKKKILKKGSHTFPTITISDIGLGGDKPKEFSARTINI